MVFLGNECDDNANHPRLFTMDVSIVQPYYCPFQDPTTANNYVFGVQQVKAASGTWLIEQYASGPCGAGVFGFDTPNPNANTPWLCNPTYAGYPWGSPNFIPMSSGTCFVPCCGVNQGTAYPIGHAYWGFMTNIFTCAPNPRGTMRMVRVFPPP